MKKITKVRTREARITKTSNYLTAVVMVLVPFHAFLTVWGSTFAGHFFWLRLWDEALLLILFCLAGVLLWQDRSLLKITAQNRLVQLIGAFTAVTVLWGVAAYVLHQVTLAALGYGIVVDLRFLVWFLCVYIVAQKSSWMAANWKGLVFWPLAAVVAFGLLQFFVWPPDVLKEFGYGPNTYVPYITLNQDSTIVRIQSTLRGTNELGAYAALMLTLLATLLVSRVRAWKPWLLTLGTTLTLVLTFSRSGWIAALVGIAVVVIVRLPFRFRRLAIILACAGVVVIGAASVFELRSSSEAQNLIYHANDHTTATQTSNQQHASALVEHLSTVIHEPLGRGTGSSGQASWYNVGHPIRNTESLLLQIGEETGWLGLGLFFTLLVQLGHELWTRRSSNLALALFASLVGITLISFVTYSWIDDTLAFIWWGLAAIALAAPNREKVAARQ